MHASQPGCESVVIGRFAPSPTGRMHAGNIYAALCSWLVAKSQGGRIVLRIEDLDRDRSRTAYAAQAMRDFEALGLTWDEGPAYQHDRKAAYQEALATLEERGIVYPCFCTRADLHAQSAPHAQDRIVYGGTCRHLSERDIAVRMRERAAEGRLPAMRVRVPDERLSFCDLVQGNIEQRLLSDCGDFVVRRSDGGFAYQLAVVVDDAAAGVNCVVRGCDLLASTPQQIYLQGLLGLPTPAYAHIPLLCAPDGRRLAKRDRDAEYGELLARYGSPEAVVGHIAYQGLLQDEDAPATPDELLATFSLDAFRSRAQGVRAIAFDEA